MHPSRNAYNTKVLSLIIEIKTIVKSKGRVRSIRVTVSDGRTFELDKEIFKFYRLKEGMELACEQFDRMLEQSQEKLAKDYALDYLGTRERSEKEIRDRLKQRKIQDAYIDRAVKDLKRTGLINDRSYAVRCCRDLLDRKPMGGFLLRQELRKRGIPETTAEEVIGECLQEKSAHSLALRAVRKRPQLLRITDENERKRKMYDFLMRRGFNFEEIGEAVAAVEDELKTPND